MATKMAMPAFGEVAVDGGDDGVEAAEQRAGGE